MNRHSSVLPILLGAAAAAALAVPLAGEQPEYFQEQQNLPTRASSMARRGGGDGQYISTLLPYAYYPSRRQLEVALEFPEANAPAGGQVEVRIVPVGEADERKAVLAGKLVLDAQRCGRALFDIPDLPDGNYAVTYTVGGKAIRSPRVLKRLHFPWERPDQKFGAEDKIFPPFEAVAVAGNVVRVVGREYRVNGFGAFDSVRSLGRELLAGPIALVGQCEGKPIAWARQQARGKKISDARAELRCSADSERLRADAFTEVEEDGCARVILRIAPAGGKPVTVEHLTLEIPIQDAEAPLFHFVGDQSMRHNYGGVTPRGGRIVWDITSQYWCPIVWKAEKGPDDGVLWDSTQVKTWRSDDYRPFVPYIWLGAEQRGLAWFAENESGYVVGDGPIQQVVREGDRVVVKIHLIAKPAVLDKPRTVVFGLMASPTKPMDPNWREHKVATGIGPVTCWGGYQCNSKYPDGADYTIVDKIQEARRTGKADLEWFAERDKRRVWPERRINEAGEVRSGREPKTWLWLVQLFARRAADSNNTPAGTYFEEHATDTRLPEWEVFQDEWASVEFNRFQARPGNWGVFSDSYRDFALWHANQWMQRGVSLYFDNTNPKRCYNPRGGPAWVDPNGVLRFGTAIFGPRRYYRRIWKLMSEWNAKGAPYPIDVTYHVTSTRTLPFNTWCSATLDLEQRYRLPEKYNDVSRADKPKYQVEHGLPWPADYTRAVILGRQSGSIPYVLDPLRSDSRHHFFDRDGNDVLANWGMQMVHEIRGPGPTYGKYAQMPHVTYGALVERFGYPSLTVSHNYWDEKPSLQASDPNVKWLLLTRKTDRSELVILQSYSRQAVRAQVRIPGSLTWTDAVTGEKIPTDPAGALNVSIPANFGTRLILGK